MIIADRRGLSVPIHLLYRGMTHLCGPDRVESCDFKHRHRDKQQPPNRIQLNYSYSLPTHLYLPRYTYMATQVATQTNTRGSGNRGRKGGRGRGGNRGGRQGGSKQESKAPAEKQEEASSPTDSKTSEAAAEADDAAICWICAEPVKYYSVSQCNHRTCHVCGLRLRALYKKLECTFCKVI